MSDDHARTAPLERRIERGGNTRHYWADAWRARALISHLTRRDIVVRYKQTVAGLMWAFVRPFVSMIVFTFVFRSVAQLDSDGDTPYALMVFAGLLPWQLFAGTVSRGASSQVRNSSLITRIYFPRVILVIHEACVAGFDFLVSLLLLALLMLIYAWAPDARLLLLPAFILLAVITGVGLSLWLSALNVHYRDIAYFVPFLLQIGQFISPVGFSSSVIGDDYRLLYALNPLVSVVDGTRWSLLGGQVPLYLPGVILGTSIALVLFFSGLWFFRRVESTFADAI